MNSLKTTLVCIVLLVVGYGMYQIVTSPPPDLSEDEYGTPTPGSNEVVSGESIDPSQLFAKAEGDSSTDAGEVTPPNLASDTSKKSLLPENPSAAPGLIQPKVDGSFSATPEKSEAAPAPPLASSPNNKFAPPATLPATPSTSIPSTPSLPPASSNSLAPTTTQTPTPGGGGSFGGSSPTLPTSPGSSLGSNSTTPSTPPSDIQLDREDYEKIAQEKRSQKKLATVWPSVQAMIDKNDYKGALLELSYYYDDPTLTKEESENLEKWLDALAGKVIYSTENLMDPPHIVKKDDTLETIAKAYGVSADLLANINRATLGPSGALTPGMELKVVSGPFRAKVDLSKNRMTLFARGYYAGRFPIKPGNEPTPVAGSHFVQVKSDQGIEYVNSQGIAIAASSMDNPYGSRVLKLNNGAAIHDSPAVVSTARGSISLGPKDALDVYSILNTGSQVTVVR